MPKSDGRSLSAFLPAVGMMGMSSSPKIPAIKNKAKQTPRCTIITLAQRRIHLCTRQTEISVKHGNYSIKDTQIPQRTQSATQSPYIYLPMVVSQQYRYVSHLTQTYPFHQQMVYHVLEHHHHICHRRKHPQLLTIYIQGGWLAPDHILYPPVKFLLCSFSAERLYAMMQLETHTVPVKTIMFVRLITLYLHVPFPFQYINGTLEVSWLHIEVDVAHCPKERILVM